MTRKRHQNQPKSIKRKFSRKPQPVKLEPSDLPSHGLTLPDAYKEMLSTYCNASPDSIVKALDRVEGVRCFNTIHGHMIYIPSSVLGYTEPAKILGIAHIDTVSPKSIPGVKPKWDGEVIQSIQLDDRLGIFTLLQILPHILKCPVPFDVLLCDSEESGQSTGQFFADYLGELFGEFDADISLEANEWKHPYNWMFEFDRAGTDAVVYEYEDKAHEARIEKHGWVVDMGAFSDISYMQSLGVKATNFGVGYHRQHSERCYADTRHTIDSAACFVRYAQEFEHTHMPHVERHNRFTGPWRGYLYDTSYSSSYGPRLGDDDDENTLGDCGYCGECICSSDWVYCPMCGSVLNPGHVSSTLGSQWGESGWTGGSQ